MKKLLILMVAVLMSACCSKPSFNHDTQYNQYQMIDENDNLIRKMAGLPATPEDLTKFIYETD